MIHIRTGHCFHGYEIRVNSGGGDPLWVCALSSAPICGPPRTGGLAVQVVVELFTPSKKLRFDARLAVGPPHGSCSSSCFCSRSTGGFDDNAAFVRTAAGQALAPRTEPYRSASRFSVEPSVSSQPRPIAFAWIACAAGCAYAPTRQVRSPAGTATQ